VSPEGQVDRIVEMPLQNITTCAFGGADLKTLFISTASIVSPRGNRLAGSLFSLRVGVPGMAENRFVVEGVRPATSSTSARPTVVAYPLCRQRRQGGHFR
jgi:hypothetical protein